MADDDGGLPTPTVVDSPADVPKVVALTPREGAHQPPPQALTPNPPLDTPTVFAAIERLVRSTKKSFWRLDIVMADLEVIRNALDLHIRDFSDSELRMVLRGVHPARSRLQKGSRGWVLSFLAGGSSVVSAIVGISEPAAWGFAPIGVLLGSVGVKATNATARVYETADAICETCREHIGDKP